MKRSETKASVLRYIRTHGASTRADLVRSLFGPDKDQIQRSLEQLSATDDLMVSNGLYDLPVSRIAVSLRGQLWNGGLVV